MTTRRLLAFVSVLAALLAADASAQNTTAQTAGSAAQQPRSTASRRAATPAQPTTAQQAAVQLQAVPVEQKCLRALNGACTNPAAVEIVRRRAEIIPAVSLSYFGTPAGTVGGDVIPFERLFQDNPLLYGLPTFVFVQPCCVTRTK